MSTDSMWLVILFGTALGAGIIAMLVLNSIKFSAYRREVEGRPPAHALGKWAWGVSVFSLVVFYIAPVSLLMGLIDLRRSAAPPDSPSRRPARMAILNSAFAIAAFLVTLGVLFGTGALRWAS
ncbi:MAG: hypothetical protein LJF15_12820 [Acidobacteria bacterium]|nr:hypothetical protein [Acidobacteriota bacterium]